MIEPPYGKLPQLRSVPADALAFLVADLKTARTALEAAAQLERFPILLSPPDAASFMGFPWWKALMDLLRNSAAPHDTCGHALSPLCGGLFFIDILDCGAAAGRAAMALSGGQKHIIFSPASPQTPAIQMLAASLGAQILSHPPKAIPVAPGTTSATLAAYLRDHPAPGHVAHNG